MNEITSENATLLEKRYRMTVLIVLAQILVTIILTAAAWLMVSNAEFSGTEQSLTTLWVAMLFMALGSFVIRRLFFAWERLRNIALLKGIPRVLGTLQTNSLILGAFAEIIAILGFVVTMFSGSSLDMFRAAAISLIVFFINFPRKKVWKTIIANLQGV